MRVISGSWLGSYHKYGTYLVISHTNIEIPMESSELTQLRSNRLRMVEELLFSLLPSKCIFAGRF
jgi:hypothetical protein